MGGVNVCVRPKKKENDIELTVLGCRMQRSSSIRMRRRRALLFWIEKIATKRQVN